MQKQGVCAHPSPAPESQTLSTPQPGYWDAELWGAGQPSKGSCVSEPLRPAQTWMDAVAPGEQLGPEGDRRMGTQAWRGGVGLRTEVSSPC